MKKKHIEIDKHLRKADEIVNELLEQSLGEDVNKTNHLMEVKQAIFIAISANYCANEDAIYRGYRNRL